MILDTRSTAVGTTRRLLRFGLCQIFLCFLLLLAAKSALANECETRNVFTSSTESVSLNPAPIYHEFPSGARWQLCLSFDTHSGLVVTDVAYGAPAEPVRKVLNELALGQILLKYDEDTEATHVLSDFQFGADNVLENGPGFCDDGEWVATPGPASSNNICKRQRDINNLTQVRREVPLRRRELSLHTWAKANNFIFQTIWRFSEDGEITPAVHMQGRLTRYTTDPRYGTPVAGTDRLANSATLLVNWRLDFDIAGNEHPDVVEEVEFPAMVQEAVSRPITVRPILTESLLTVGRDTFRGWLVRDSVISAATSGRSRVGYYLDPQTSGYSYRSRQSNWPSFDVIVTRAKACERLASRNPGQNAGCEPGLDQFFNNEPIVAEDIVMWFSVARHLVPRSEDYPAIGSLAAEFKLIPFDWSAHTPFTPPGNEP